MRYTVSSAITALFEPFLNALTLMTYARSRLWLGVTGVGSLVTIATVALFTGLPAQLLSDSGEFGTREFLQLAGLTGLFVLWIMPLDFLGGYLLPERHRKSTGTFTGWLKQYLPAALLQAALFVLFGTLIIVLSQQYGSTGGFITISLGIIGCFVTRNHLLLQRELHSRGSDEKLLDAISRIQSWDIFVPRTVVVDHRDIGFTGGVVGFGTQARIVIPRAWLDISREQLATAIARRAVAINSGSYTRGLLLAFAWNVCGFAICSLVPGAGLTSVSGLATTLCGFTIWSFFGLLTLPTVSRNASLRIDQELVRQGMPGDLISTTAFTMDQMQDGEPDRSRWIETIFHPVPKVTSRVPGEPIRGIAAWNVARTTLFFSWGCLGFLSRAVHCNVGRPELWTMLPTD